MFVLFVAFDRFSTLAAMKGYSEAWSLSSVVLVKRPEAGRKIGRFRHSVLLAYGRSHSRHPMMFGLVGLMFHLRRRVTAVVGKVDCSCLVIELHLWHSMFVLGMLGVEMTRS